jgi:uncharacterized protein YyaL (SSP411 family)
LDADSLDDHGHHREGAFYAWSRDQLIAALGAEDGTWAASVFSVTEQGTFEDGLSTLQLLDDPDPERLADVRARLLAVREQRARPARDDKVVVAWNGWLISSLIDAAMVFDQPAWLESAWMAGELLWRVHWVDGRLRRTSRDGEVGSALGILEDYAALAQAYVGLAAATAQPLWLERGRELLDVILTQFGDGSGGFFDTAADAEQLYARPHDPTDNATPSGLSATVHALQAFAHLTGEEGYAARAEEAAATAGQLIVRAPRFAGWLLADAISRTPKRRPLEVAIVGPSGDPARAELVRTAHRMAPAGSVILAGEPDQAGFELLLDRPLIEGRPTAYVCQHFVCKLPVTSAEDLVVQLGGEVAA